MSYKEALEWLFLTQRFGVKLGLENMRRLIEVLELTVDEPPAYFHVAGTNGKGSVCAMIEAICRSGGCRTGLFTSPHLVSFRERIQINREMISREDVADGLTRLRDLTKSWRNHPTFFELTTALALEYFQRANVEIVVLETGMGGRLDATNVVTPRVAVLTPISIDHQNWLGNSLEEIAGEKAGIIKPDRPVVSSPQPAEIGHVLSKTAMVRGARLSFVTESYEGAISLSGSIQKQNAALAIRAVREAGVKVQPEEIEAALAGLSWIGRFHLARPDLILDGAHNQAAAEALAATWREAFGAEKANLIIGILKDKDHMGICRALLPLARRVYTVPVNSERSADPQGLRDIAAAVNPGIPVVRCDTLEEALAKAETDGPAKTLVTGSCFLVGEALALLKSTAVPRATSQ